MNTLELSVSRVARIVAIAMAMLLPAIPLAASAQVFVSFNIGAAPPPLPYYSQPMLTQPGQVWQPGYWAWGPAGYYWVPGTWVTPPSAGLYWTPGYWGYNNGSYSWNNGFWAPQVGYYGGIDYGFGYFGNGFTGGYWNNGTFAYNTAVTAVNPTIVRNVYVRRIVEPRVVTRFAFNGPGGVIARPTARELVVTRERHIAPTAVQVEHARIASQDRSLAVVANGGHPRVLAVARPIRTAAALPHFTRVTAVDEARARARIARAHATTAREHAATARAHAATARARAETARAHAAAARAHAQAARAHEQTVRLHSERARALTTHGTARASSGKTQRQPKNNKKPPLH